MFQTAGHKHDITNVKRLSAGQNGYYHHKMTEITEKQVKYKLTYHHWHVKWLSAGQVSYYHHDVTEKQLKYQLTKSYHEWHVNWLSASQKIAIITTK